MFTSLQETIATGKDMLAALDQLGPERTGGFLPVTLDKVRQFVGNQDVDYETFDIYAKQRMINDLRKFGANPTAGRKSGYRTAGFVHVKNWKNKFFNRKVYEDSKPQIPGHSLFARQSDSNTRRLPYVYGVSVCR